jgi:hypothetical protein
LASSLDHPPVVSGRVSVIPVMHWDVHQLVVIKKVLKFLVTTHGNGTQLLLGPRVKVDWSYKWSLDAHTSVDSCAVEADEYRVVDWCPLRHQSPAIEAMLVFCVLH